MRVVSIARIAAPVALLWSGVATAQDDLLARGELLFDIGGCTNCHTAKGGPLLAGGAGIKSPYGTFFAPNITPDVETGIGGWSELDFFRAMREGRSPDGRPYYPAFPYTSYTLLADEDLRALKAYLDTIEPARQNPTAHELGFPYNIRFGLRLWQWLFFEPSRFPVRPGRDAQWNRGAYLVNGPGHCQECHTPRTWTGALDYERAFAGADLGPDAKVPNITPARIGDWSEQDFLLLFQLGMKPDGDFVGGEMAKIVENGTSRLPDADLMAIIAFLQSLPGS
jgi:mono/diheme cytochrome c family protein